MAGGSVSRGERTGLFCSREGTIDGETCAAVRYLSRGRSEVRGLRNYGSGVSQNISGTGVLIRAFVTAEPGAGVHLAVKEFNAVAEVGWTKKTEGGLSLGMEFVSMGWGDRSALNRLFEFMHEHG